MRDVLAHFGDVRKDGDGWAAKCPAHDDHRASLSIGHGDGGRWLLHCHAHCTLDAILAAVQLEARDLFPETTTTKSTIVATYPYHDEGGGHLYDVVRFMPKDFRQRRADGTWKMAGVRRVLFGLPELQGQSVAYIVEGEEDVKALRAIGLVSTTNSGGAGKWLQLDRTTGADLNRYAQQLTAAGVESVVVLPDNDDPGRLHADQIALACTTAGLHVKVVALQVPAKEDVRYWLNAGHTRDELAALVKATALYTPNSVPAGDQVPADDLALTSLDTLLSEPDDKIEWLIDGLIASGSVNMLAGKPKAGKSTLARQMAFCLATGTPFIGHPCLGGVVWYLVLEDKRAEVRRHFRALGATGGEPVRFLFGNTKDLMAKLARLAERERPFCIIVDTLQRLIFAKDLNDYAEVTTRLDPVLTIARTTGAAIILVHHAAKADRAGVDAVLGSTALTGSVDNVFLLNRTDRYRVLSSVQRIGADLEETVITLDDSGRARSGQSRHTADVDFVRAALLQALTTSAGLTRDEWLEAVEGRKQVKLEALRHLIDSGTTFRTGTGKRNDAFRYHVAVGGSQVPSDSWEPETHSSTLVDFPKAVSGNGGSQVPTFSEGGSRADIEAHQADLDPSGESCCKGGMLQLQCKLCRQSPTYWAKETACSTN